MDFSVTEHFLISFMYSFFLELLIDNLKTSGYLYYGATTLTQSALGYFIYGAMLSVYY
jgi:hypothetical protein